MNNYHYSESEDDSFESHPNFSVFVLGNVTCRACLAQDEEMQSLFSVQEWHSLDKRNELLNMFISCTSLDVTFNDLYPKHICNSCFKELHEAYGFWKKCRQSIEQVDKITKGMHIGDTNSKTDYLIDKCDTLIDDNINNLNNASKTFPKNETIIIDQETSKTQNASEKSPKSQCRTLKLTNNDTYSQIEGSHDKSKEQVNTDQLQCHKCNITFSNTKDYETHLDIIHKITIAMSTLNQAKCKKCQIVFSSRNAYKLHWYNNHNHKMHTKLDSSANGTDVSETNQESISEQFVILNDDESSMCDLSPKNAQKHKCRKCNLTFANKSEYKKHAAKHNEHLCPQCGRVFNKKNHLNLHLITHSTLRPFQCNICNKTYRSHAALYVHKSTHKGELRYSCEHCDKKFVTWNARYKHIKAHHTAYDKHVCEICTLGFRDASALKIHVRKHTGEKPHACNDCSMTFISSSQLAKHRHKHSDIKKYSCVICEKKFIRSSGLKQHMVTHTGERKHKCETCGKAFTQAHVLRSHMKLHETIKLEEDLTN